MALIHKLCAWAVVLLGAVHVAYTALAARTWSAGAAWFLGAGLAFVFLGLLNVTTSAHSPRRSAWTCLAANVLGLLYAVAVATVLPEPQAFVAVILLLVLLGTVATLLVRGRAIEGRTPPAPAQSVARE